jgi:hypothetical protein
MRKIISVLLIAGAASISAAAQSTPIPLTEREAKPQVAYRLFSNWADNYERNARRGKSIAEGVLFGTGALFVGGAAATWYGGDEISMRSSGSPMDLQLKQNLTLGFGITGGILLASGFIAASVPIKDYRAIYADVFQERDPEVQEAMAVSVLRYQADRGRERRITSFITGIVVPILAGGIKAGYNLSVGDRWSNGVWDTMNYSSWSAVSGIISLFSKTDEERLYERYINTRDALNGASR